MIVWKAAKMSREGDLEAKLVIPNPVEPEFEMTIQISLYGPYDGKDMRKTWFGRVDFGAGSRTELFRIYDEDKEKAKERIETGLRDIFGALAKEVEPLPHDIRLLEAAVKFPAFNDRPRRGRIPFVWMSLDPRHYEAAERLVQQDLAEVDGEGCDLPKRMRVTLKGKRELARLGLIQLDDQDCVVEV